MKTISLGLRALVVAGACLLANSAEAKTFGTGLDIPVDKDPVAWTVAGQRHQPEERVTVLLREGETIDDWTEIIVIKEQPHKPTSPGPFRGQFVRALKRKHGRSGVQIDKEIASDGHSFLFGYKTAEEMELVRAMKQRGQGFLVVTYTCKNSKDTQAAKDLYTNILWSSEMTGKRA